MASDLSLTYRDRAVLVAALLLVLCGAAMGGAAAHGLWLACGAALMVALWQGGHLLGRVRQPPISPAVAAPVERERMIDRLLLDAAPTPLVSVEQGVVRVLNRSARTLFAADDRVVSAPPALFDRTSTYVRYAARHWRMDRVAVGPNDVVALIDIESEERTAEARASAEMVRVLGHEMLNGLVPIVSLAECGVAAADPQRGDPALLPEILSTLARHAEGLQRFTEAYRTLARLPPPFRQTVSVAELVDDLARLFAGRWPDARLTVRVGRDLCAALDRDQLNQALWALLQNAVEAAEPGKAAIVHLNAYAAQGKLIMEIKDEGPDFPTDTLNIRRPFHSTKPTGTGIGLSLARQIVQAHGGVLTFCRTDVTTFSCTVPL